MKIQIQKLTKKAEMPFQATVGAAGYDIYCTRTETTKDGKTLLCHTDIAMAIPEGYAGIVFPRSSVALRGMSMCNSVGVIDSDYRGEITGMFTLLADAEPYKPGERFAQIVFMPVQQVKFGQVAALPETTRGTGGYGSTGKA